MGDGRWEVKGLIQEERKEDDRVENVVMDVYQWPV